MSPVGGIEAGGSKFICAIGSGPDDLESIKFATTTPDETIGGVVDFFKARKPVDAIGIGSFGPIDPNPESPTFGYITSTPKLAWRNFDFAGAIRKALGVKVAFATDVNAAAFGEFRWGAAQGLKDFLYLTVGTGIGGGGMVNGRLVHGRSHPEMGHIRIPHYLDDEPFPGNCPYHRDGLEGLASAPAIEARWAQPAEALANDHPAWDLEAHYIALGLNNWICTLSPERIILGGGVMRREGLLALVKKNLTGLLNNYIDLPEIVAPALGHRAGVLGAIALAAQMEELT